MASVWQSQAFQRLGPTMALDFLLKVQEVHMCGVANFSRFRLVSFEKFATNFVPIFFLHKDFLDSVTVQFAVRRPSPDMGQHFLGAMVNDIWLLKVWYIIGSADSIVSDSVHTLCDSTYIQIHVWNNKPVKVSGNSVIGVLRKMWKTILLLTVEWFYTGSCGAYFDQPLIEISQAVWEVFRFNFLKGDSISDRNISQEDWYWYHLHN